MLVAHNIVDVLKAVELTKTSRGLMPIRGLSVADCHRARCGIEAAAKFDFGDLPFEWFPQHNLTAAYGFEAVDGKTGVFSLPELTAQEKEFWIENLIPLPFKVCWYEFRLGKTRSGLIVSEMDDDSWSVERIDYTPPEIVFDAVVCKASRAATRARDSTLSMTAGGNMMFLEAMKNNKLFMDNNIGANVPLAIWLTLMLNSRTSEVRTEPAPAKLNKKRMRLGRTPLAEHRIVTIVPERFRKASEDEAKGTHRPPRLHWRRSHLRHYDHHVPSARWMPEKSHEGSKGWWVAVIPRMLVGRAELGEVSHEYRLATEKAGHGAKDALTSAPAGNDSH